MTKSTLAKDSAAETLSKAAAAAAGVMGFDVNAPASILSTTASKRLFGFTRKILPPGLPDDVILWIYSISEYGDTVDLGAGLPKFTIEPWEDKGPDGPRHGPGCPIKCLVFLEEAKVDVTEHTPFTAQQLADSVMKIGPGMPASLNRQKVGWFTSKSNPPDDRDLLKAIELYTVECKKLVAQGEKYHAANKLDEIGDEHRRAARFLRQKVNWDRPTHKMIDCPRCQEPVRADAMIHATPYCGHVLKPVPYWASMVLAGQKTLADVPEGVQVAVGKEITRLNQVKFE